MQKDVSLIKGKILRNLIIFTIPILLGNLFQQLYNVVDTLIVGNFLGTNSLAAVSSSANLIFLLVGFFNGLAIGGGVVISRYFGAKDHENLSLAIHTMVAFGIITGVLLTLIGLFGAPFILKLMDTPPDVLPLSIKYFRVYFLGSIGFVLYNILVGIMRSLGNSKDPLKYLIFASILNIILDLFFIVGLHLNVEAVALATAISQSLSAVLCFIKLSRAKDLSYRLNWRKIKLNMPKFKEIIKYGLPSGIQNSIISLGNTIVQTNINSFGANAIAGIGSYNKIEGFAFLPITSFSMALTTFVSQNIGAKQYERAHKGANYGIICAMLIAQTLGIIFYLCAPSWLSLFDRHQAVIDYGVVRVHSNTMFYCLLAFSHCVAGVLRGLGRPIVPMIIMMVCWCFIRVGLLMAILPYYHHFMIVCIIYPITWTLSAIVFAIYYHRLNWDNIS